MDLHIIGGGPAGLVAGYFAKQQNLTAQILEGSSELGGNCRTISFGEFMYDTGAHRFHDKNKDVTDIIKTLMGDELLKVNSPSKIFWKKKLINFPLEFSNIFKTLDKTIIMKIFLENIINIFSSNKDNMNFKELSYKNYGKTLAELFLINYTEKLWGLKANDLNNKIAGDRLKGLNLSSIIEDLFKKNNINQKHLDGSFYYPKNGFGSIFKSIGDYVGQENISFNSNVVEIHHDNNLIKNLIVENNEAFPIKSLISTLPLNLLIKYLRPTAPKDIMNISNNLKYRGLRLAIIALDLNSFSDNASIYYPQSNIPFTRIYEPKNRSKNMAPSDKTCIVVEVPCQPEDLIYNNSEDEFLDKIKYALSKYTHINESNIINTSSQKVPFAYPILDYNIDDKLNKIFSYLSIFKNLNLLGRSAEFKYLHTHDLFIRANQIVNTISN
jgi:protoporphyrinogen oxidase